MYNEESLISLDYKQIEESSIIDGQWIKVLDKNVLKIFDVKVSMNSKKSYGGTSSNNIKKMIKKYKKK